jgi:hypothetical protein
VFVISQFYPNLELIFRPLVVVWVLWLSTSADTARFNRTFFRGTCNFSDGFVKTTCHEVRTVEAFAFIIWIIRKFIRAYTGAVPPFILCQRCSHGLLHCPPRVRYCWQHSRTRPWNLFRQTRHAGCRPCGQSNPRSTGDSDGVSNGAVSGWTGHASGCSRTRERLIGQELAISTASSKIKTRFISFWFCCFNIII